ncbi:MAG: TatD family deoxyribonuclease [Ignavibacteriae bacterium]|nr:MAG: TatD family deoxyribonuclease [Ignavibacteriota bacterium]
MTAPNYIDSHAHLFFADYADDLEAVLTRAQEAGVGTIIVPGTDLKSSREAVLLAEQHQNIFACVGIHPHEASKADSRDLEEIEKLCANPNVVAIGEIGLDYHYDFSPRDVQQKFLTAQLDIAVRNNLPVVLHTRESNEDLYSLVEQTVKAHPAWREAGSEPGRGVFHCFPGTAEQAAYVFSLGFCVSYPGIVTFKKAQSIDVIKEIGIRNLLLETDSPYMTPVPYRGKRNEPANIVLIGKKIAESLNISEDEVARTTTENAVRLFGLHR